MRRVRAAAGASFLLVSGALLVLAPTAPAPAAVVDPLALVHTEQVYGDFEMVGNSVLTCPDDDTLPTCTSAGNRVTTANNNDFDMQYADVDGNPDTYNSSTGVLEIPSGARVTHARLQWSGNDDGAPCGIGNPGSYPTGSSETTAVSLRVGDGDPVDVAPETHSEDTGTIRYYIAGADVTAAFADVPSGSPVEVTVGNVFAPTGNGCHGGWSLIVVHDDPGAACGTERREVFVYDGYVRQGSADAPTDLTVSGFRVSGSPARIGVTAYEGDSATTGDRFSINGTNLAEPGGAALNFFRSSADHQGEPSFSNNFSVDAKKLDVPAGVIPIGSTSAAIQTRTTGDAYALQSVVLSVPVPALCMQKSVSPPTALPGQTLTWTITVSNPTTGDALGVEVSDPLVPDCERTLGTVAAGATTTYTCTSTATADLTNVATASGTAVGGNALTASAAASVDVVAPDIAITKSVAPRVALPGDPVQFTITVSNTGDTELTAVAVDDDPVDTCDRSALGPLAEGASTTYTCTATVGEDDLDNTATATGSAALGPPVAASDTATVDVVHPALALEKSVSDDEVPRGTEVTFTVTATNEGDVVLEDVAIDDPLVPACAASGVTLPPGATHTVTCPFVVTEDVENAASVDGRVLDGERALGPFEATARVTVTVEPPQPTQPPGPPEQPGGPAAPGQPSGQPPGGPQGGTAPVAGQLPDTGAGADLLPLALVGLGLVVGGAAVLLRRRHTWPS